MEPGALEAEHSQDGAHLGAIELPDYTSSQSAQLQLTEHKSQLEDSKGKAWLWLSVKSRAKVAKQPPFFVSGDKITGSVEVDLDIARNARGLSVGVIAGITAVGQEEAVFLNVPQALWDNTTVSPRKSAGIRAWPFSIQLPSEVTITVKGGRESQKFPLPPSFSERASPAYVEYRLIATVRRSFLRANQTLIRSFVYLPTWRAEPPSLLRQVAYREGTPLIGPDHDSEGWEMPAPVVITGSLFSTRQIELRCSLAVARPLSYAKGTLIPLLLTIQGEDEQAIDLLATPAAVKIYLIRCRVLGTHATDQEESTVRSDHVFRDTVDTAYFWPFTDTASAGSRARTLRGELRIKSSLKPSFVFPGFSLRYSIVLGSPQAPGFANKAPVDEPLMQVKINIASLDALGVVHRSYAPPEYAHTEGTDFNNTLGYLENGNQRFLHHGGFSIG